MTTYQVLNSPLVIAIVTSILGLLGAFVTALVRLTAMLTTIRDAQASLALDVKRMIEDKDVMRWSEYRSVERLRGMSND